MKAFLADIRGLDRQAWLVIGMVGSGNAILLIAGLEGNPAYSLAILSILGIAWVGLLQLTRMIMHSSLELAKESSEAWQNEIDFSQELVEDYVNTIRDLKRYDLQASGIHLERLRTMLIKRRPELEDEIDMVEHPVGVTGGFII